MNQKLLKSLLIFVAVLSCVSASAQEKWTGIDRYAADNEKLMAAPADTARIVLLGNSITDFWPTRSPEFFKRHPQLVGRGISGQTSHQMLVRFREDVVNLHPKAVVINCGTNDIAENHKIPYSEANTMGNIKSMVEIAKANGIKKRPTSPTRWRVSTHASKPTLSSKASPTSTTTHQWCMAPNVNSIPPTPKTAYTPRPMATASEWNQFSNPPCTPNNIIW